MKGSPLPGLLATALWVATANLAVAQHRVALVIGNNAYPAEGNFSSLENCVGDADLIRATLTSLGFRVFYAENATRSEMDTILTEFENAIPRGGSAVFYFAGHGIEFDGKNYLMGVNAKLEGRSRLGEEAMDAETFATAMLVAGAKSSFLFLDCCRDAPKDAQWLTRGTKKRGLAELNIDGDIIIAYAAKPGQAALDGQYGNSPYARALSRWLPSGLKHGDLFDQVRQEVHQVSGGAQRTWESGSFLEPYYFRGTAAVSPPPPLPLAERKVPTTPMSTPGRSEFSKSALSRFEHDLSAAIRRSPNLPPDAKNSEQLRQFQSLAADLVAIDHTGLPPDLAEEFADFRDTLQRTSQALAQFPGLDWDDPQAILAELGRSDQKRGQTLASVPDLARECQTAGEGLDAVLAKHGLAIK